MPRVVPSQVVEVIDHGAWGTSYITPVKTKMIVDKQLKIQGDRR
jgi:hypothetical protein